MSEIYARKARSLNWRPRRDLDLEIAVDTYDVIEGAEEIRWGLVNVEVREGCVAADIIKAVHCTQCVRYDRLLIDDF